VLPSQDKQILLQGEQIAGPSDGNVKVGQVVTQVPL